MEPSRQTTRILHDEHVATLSLLNRLDAMLADAGPKRPPDVAGAGLAPLLNDLATTLDGEIGHHFDFEERELFPRLADFGDAGIGAFLAEEHKLMLPLGGELASAARAGAKNGFTPDEWSGFHRQAAEMVERMMDHIQKEEMGLLPVLDDLLDEDEDRDLANAYLMSR